MATNDHEVPSLPESQKFFDDLIENRFEVISSLAPLANHGYGTGGYQGRFHTTPDFLLPYLESGNTDDVEVGLSYGHSPQGEISLSVLRIQPVDGPELTLTTDDMTTRLMVNREEREMFFGRETIHDALRSLIPQSKRTAKIGEIASAIYMVSPATTHEMTIKDPDTGAELQVAESESVDDSQHAILIRVPWEHVSGQNIVLCTTINETLLRARSGVTAHCDVSINAGAPSILFEEIINGRSIEIEHPRISHTRRLESFIESLLDKAAAQNTPTTE